MEEQNNWFSKILDTGLGVFKTLKQSDAPRASTLPTLPQSQTPTWLPLAIGGGVILLVIGLVFAFRK